MPRASFNNAVGPHARRRQNVDRRLVAVLLGLTAVAALQTATEVWAADFEYQTALGQAWAGLLALGEEVP